VSADVTKALVIQHEDECPPAWFGAWFRAAGLDYDVVLGHRGDTVPQTLGPYAALVVLGGEMGANDDASCPWLTPTKSLIRHTVAGGRAFLGICLGHQLAGAALGGEVIANPNGQAKGLTVVSPTDAGQADPLTEVVRPGSVAVQWNDDVVWRLPAGAVELATSPDGTVQAARFGDRAWGVQFHPEAGPDVFDEWTGSAKGDAEQQEQQHKAAELIRAADEQLQEDWRPLAERFAALVLATTPGSTHHNPRFNTPQPPAEHTTSPAST
jgi:GMP synthase (glutamine-hydrolysing)